MSNIMTSQIFGLYEGEMIMNFDGKCLGKWPLIRVRRG
jgi:hypothetical protein